MNRRTFLKLPLAAACPVPTIPIAEASHSLDGKVLMHWQNKMMEMISNPSIILFSAGRRPGKTRGLMYLESNSLIKCLDATSSISTLPGKYTGLKNDYSN